MNSYASNTLTNGNVKTIAVDAMGADLGPSEVVEGVFLAFKEVRNLGNVILVGQQDILEPLIHAKGLHKEPRLTIRHASEVIEMAEKPVQSLRQKRDSSMVRALELVCDGTAQAILSCGNTGSLMAGGTLKLRPMCGIERPALAIVSPTKDHNFVLLDAGANPESTAKHLVHNAILGYHYAKVALNRPHPRVGLLTIGTEEGKGNESVNVAHEHLKKLGDTIDYKGLIEGFQVFHNHVDVIVCDGFVGNVLLKTCESLIENVKSYLKEQLGKNPIRQLGALLAMGAFKNMRKQFNPECYSGAPLLGLKGTVVKAHGSSNRRAIMHALRLSHEMAANELDTQMAHSIEQINKTLFP